MVQYIKNRLNNNGGAKKQKSNFDDPGREEKRGKFQLASACHAIEVLFVCELHLAKNPARAVFADR